MDARRDRTVGIVHGDSPDIANAEGEWPRIWSGGVMQIVAVLAEVFAERAVVFPPKEPEEFGTRLGHIHAALRIFIAQTFAGRTVVGT